ncbi:MAG: HYR domain-containing protein, partial [Bacteroidota bacterium]
MRRYLMQTLAYSLQRRVRIRSGGLWTLLTLIGLTISPQMLQAQCPDGLPPVVSGCPTNININVAPGSCANTATWTPPSFVPGGLCGITGLTSSHSPGATFPVGTTTVTYTATDAGGLSTSCSFDVIVTDNENPSLTACPANITIPAVGCTANPTWTAPTATDNCPGVILTSTANSGDAFNVGTTTVTYTATDLEGNVVTCSFTVTVTETVDPIINCPGAITINADAGLCTGTVASALATATDNCATPTITSDAPGGGADIAGSYPVGTTTVTFTATDDAGNTATCTTLITVVDNEAPSFTNCPVGLQTVNVAPGTCAGVFNYTPTFSDNCPGATVAQTSGPTVGTSQAPGSYTVAFTVTDAAGLQAVCTINYEVVDNEAPTITNCPAAVNNLNVDAATCGAVFTFNPTANDNCAVTSFVRTDATGLVSGDVFPVGTTTISYLASDAEGNTTPCSFDVVVTDNVAPVFTTCPTNITVNVDGGSCTATVSTLALAVATDDCGIASIINDFNGGGADANGTYPLGMTTVTFTATDNNGLTNNTCTVEVTVIDNIPPTITCPTNATLNLSGDANTTDCVYTIAGTALDAVPADNCTGASISNDFNASATLDGASFPLGTTTVNWTVTDGAGLTATCAFDVTVVDDVAPVITCPANIVVDTDPGNCGAVVNYTVTANDACDGAITPVAGPGVQLSGATFSVGTTVVSYSATDAAGNVSNCSFTVTVNDNEAPVLNCQNITVQLDASGNVSITPADVDDPVVPSNDNCSVVLSVSPNSFDCSTVGPQTVTLTGTDPAGNTSSCTTTVTVEDNVAPVANCQNITVQLDASGNASITAAQIDNGSNDACGIMSLAVSPNTFTCTEVGANTVTLTVTDNNNNVSTCTATVTVEDNVAPVANCQDITVQLDASGNASITAAQINNGSSDACGIMSLAVSPNTFTCADVGANTVTLTVTDNNNNVSTCTATVTVEDNVAPTA